MQFIVEQDENGSRLDRFLKRKLPNITSSLINKLSRKGKIKLNRKKCEAASRLETGDIVDIFAAIENAQYIVKPPQKDNAREFASLIIFEDEELIIINKPAGLAVQGGSKIRKSIDEMAKAYDENARLVHRIDKETSGILILARSLPSSRILTKAFEEHNISKDYVALIHGKIRPAKGTINQPLDGKSAISHYLTLQDNLLSLSPQTGRNHQLRRHLADLGHPIIGDAKYGIEDNAKRLYLHAIAVELNHPITNEIMKFQTGIPKEFLSKTTL